MTGRDLILYILQNKLEDKPVNEICCLKNFMTVDQAAAKYNVGPESIKVWFATGVISGIQIGETIYISPDNDNVVNVLNSPSATQAYDAFMRRNMKL